MSKTQKLINFSKKFILEINLINEKMPFNLFIIKFSRWVALQPKKQTILQNAIS